MSSKEEIIHDKINFLLPDIPTVKMAIRESMDLYAKQECIAFTEWLTSKESKYAVLYGENERFCDNDRDYTIEELYTLYLQQNNNH